MTSIFKLPAVLFFYIDQCWRRFRLRRSGVCLNNSTTIKGRCRITGKVEIGCDTIIQSATIDGRGGVTIGSHVIIDQASIITAQHDIDSSSYETVYAPVVIEDYVILYQGARVLPGRRIGRGAIVAVDAVVAHDVLPMAVVAGNPAKIIKYRQVVHSDCDIGYMAGFILKKKIMAQLNL